MSIPHRNAAAIAHVAQDLTRDARIVHGEKKCRPLRIFERAYDTEERRLPFVSFFEDGSQSLDRYAAGAIDGDDLVKDRPSRRDDAIEKQRGLGDPHAPRTAADEDVGIHQRYVTIAPVPPPRVSVIIPTLDESERIAATIDSAFAAGAAEVIVADGGSGDATIDIATAHGARVISGERIRARQLNRGAAEARYEMLLFLHADTRLPAGAADAVIQALDSGFVFGGFRVTFAEPGLGHVAFMINLRTRVSRAPWGDQAQFTRRDSFVKAGGFADLPIMEDYELARRMKRAGRTTLLPMHVETSGRRFVARGALRTAALNWCIIACYHLGVSPERLAQWYRKTG
jgi:rSAM/selenodomain-associated transferase 2